MIRIGIDVGGTFTDFVLSDGRQIRIHKIPSTPHEPSQAVFTGLHDLLSGPPSRSLPDSLIIVHGSTVAINALLERRGAKTALITTAGCEDLLLIGRQTRPTLYDFFVEKDPPLLSQEMIFGVEERIGPDGRVLLPLTRSDIRAVLARIRRSRAESLAVCLLFSYRNPAHERLIKKEAASLGIPISLSSDLLPEYREFERVSTTCVNAYLAPVMERYIRRLEGRITREIRIMASHGGSLSTKQASSKPIRTLFSGPAGGVIGGMAAARRSGCSRIITFDMGGTSTDICLCPGEIPLTSETIISGYPVKLPMIAIHSVGAGGGSIAWIDRGGLLRVGPRSAGADPGPICYGKGEELTITDAHLFLRHLDPAWFLGGTLPLYPEAVDGPLHEMARKLSLTAEELAWGIIEVAQATMERAVRRISVERGEDPRSCLLVPFGGAGGLHACLLAEKMGIRSVLIPRHSGALSASGLLLAPPLQDLSRSALIRTDEISHAKLDKLFAPLVEQGVALLKREGEKRIHVEKFCDMRYRGQSHEVTVPFEEGCDERFHRMHKKRYGYADPGRETEIVTLRVRVMGEPASPGQLLAVSNKKGTPGRRQTHIRPASLGERRVIFKREALKIETFDRDLLRSGMQLIGPALIYEATATTLIPPGWRGKVDQDENLLLRSHRA